MGGPTISSTTSVANVFNDLDTLLFGISGIHKIKDSPQFADQAKKNILINADNENGYGYYEKNGTIPSNFTVENFDFYKKTASEELKAKLIIKNDSEKEAHLNDLMAYAKLNELLAAPSLISETDLRTLLSNSFVTEDEIAEYKKLGAGTDSLTTRKKLDATFAEIKGFNAKKDGEYDSRANGYFDDMIKSDNEHVGRLTIDAGNINADSPIKPEDAVAKFNEVVSKTYEIIRDLKQASSRNALADATITKLQSEVAKQKSNLRELIEPSSTGKYVLKDPAVAQFFKDRLDLIDETLTDFKLSEPDANGVSNPSLRELSFQLKHQSETGKIHDAHWYGLGFITDTDYNNFGDFCSDHWAITTAVTWAGVTEAGKRAFGKTWIGRGLDYISPTTLLTKGRDFLEWCGWARSTTTTAVEESAALATGGTGGIVSAETNILALQAERQRALELMNDTIERLTLQQGLERDMLIQTIRQQYLTTIENIAALEKIAFTTAEAAANNLRIIQAEEAKNQALLNLHVQLAPQAAAKGKFSGLKTTAFFIITTLAGAAIFQLVDFRTMIWGKPEDPAIEQGKAQMTMFLNALINSSKVTNQKKKQAAATLLQQLKGIKDIQTLTKASTLAQEIEQMPNETPAE